MHNHDGDKQSSRMMWAMVICCALPLFLIFIFGAGGKALGVPAWVIFSGILVMAVIHFFMMGKSHKHSDKEHKMTSEEDNNKDNKDNKNHSGHKCCH